MLTAYDVSVQNRFEIPDVATPLYAMIANKEMRSFVYKIYVRSLRRRLRPINIKFEIILPDNGGADVKAIALIKQALISNSTFVVGRRSGIVFEIRVHKYVRDSQIGTQIREFWLSSDDIR